MTNDTTDSTTTEPRLMKDISHTHPFDDESVQSVFTRGEDVLEEEV